MSAAQNFQKKKEYKKTEHPPLRTSKGTELPMLDMRGKAYLEVKYRLVWFREDHPSWAIETELLSVTDRSAYAKATVKDETGRIIATSHKFENVQGFPDFIEKSETGAIGRALALIGYGTQFAPDLEEGERIVDSPVSKSAATPQEEPEEDVGSEPGDYKIDFGRKYKGKKLKEIPRAELESYIKWLDSSEVQDGTPLSQKLEFLKIAFERLYPKETPKNPAKEALEEMENADASPGEYTIKSGSYKGKKLKQFSQAELINMSNSIKEHFFNLNKEVPPASQDLLNAINSYLNTLEMGQ